MEPATLSEPEPQQTADTTHSERRGPSGARVGAASQRRRSDSVEPGAAGSTPWAEQLDVHTAYQPALQPRPQDDVDFYVQAYQHLHAGTTPKSLREDFFGTSALPSAPLPASPFVAGLD
eukprot:COSAG02_NODE_22424_length_753_cov_1.019878_1_plen_119_part_00